MESKTKTPQSNSKKKSPASKSKPKKVTSPVIKVKDQKTPEKVVPKIESESPENKPINGQKDEHEDEEIMESPKKEDQNVLKLQSAGSGQKGSDYNPGKKHYHPIKDAFWKKGEK